MNETKFTKGPWRVGGSQPSRIYGWLRDDKEVVVAACGSVIEQAAYNTYLIAAAPELYELFDEMSTYDECQRFKNQINELLAKARGE